MKSRCYFKEFHLDLCDSASSCRELINNLIAQKQQKTFSTEHSQLVELLLQKDTDLKAGLKVGWILSFYSFVSCSYVFIYLGSWQKNKESCSKR